jgi:serine/threonine protein kinase
MKSVAHQNLIKLEEVFETKKVVRFYSSFVWDIALIVFILKQKLYLITELCEAGELAKWIKKQGPVPEPESRLIMKQIVDAISYLHKNGTFRFV